jgi:hypothetical protein
LTAAVAVFALGLQLVLVINGEPILEDTEVPALGYRLGRFFSYFTIQSNLLVAVATVLLARDPARDGAGWRVLRLAGVSGIILTGLVHWFLIRPHLNLEGWDYTADKLLHIAVPLLAAAGWLLVGPRPRIAGQASPGRSPGRWPGSSGPWPSADSRVGTPTSSWTSTSRAGAPWP